MPGTPTLCECLSFGTVFDPVSLYLTVTFSHKYFQAWKLQALATAWKSICSLPYFGVSDKLKLLSLPNDFGFSGTRYITEASKRLSYEIEYATIVWLDRTKFGEQPLLIITTAVASQIFISNFGFFRCLLNKAAPLMSIGQTSCKWLQSLYNFSESYSRGRSIS